MKFAVKLAKRLAIIAIPRWILAKRQTIEAGVFWILQHIFRRLPLRAGFVIVITTAAASPAMRRAFEQAFRPVVAAALSRHPNFRFTRKSGDFFRCSKALTLYRIGAYGEACERITDAGLPLGRRDMAVILARSYFELGEFAEARGAIAGTCYSDYLDFEPDVAEFKAQLDLIEQDEQEALTNLARAIREARYLCPHQNIAARYPHEYHPTALDRAAGEAGRLFDACNLTGQRVTHVGKGQLGARLFGRALQAQDTLRGRFPKLSAELVEFLSEARIPLEDLRIIPVEWFTQIGHLGMLDMLFRMQELGWWQGRPVFLAYPLNIANASLLRLFERHGPVLTAGGSVSVKLARELLSLQRWSGMTFNAFRLPDGRLVPWQEAGAMMLRQWEHEQRGHPLRDEYDRTTGASIVIRRSMDRLRAKWGLKPDDWYICLHLRDAAHYGELSGTGQTHRNASVENYIDTIRYITQKGGWVVKLGGPKSPKLPKMPRVIDYARGPDRSEVADLDLIRRARLFVGTTSGLTNVAISFGIPCALVNCITVDAQLWNGRVRFALKHVGRRGGSDLSQRELTTEFDAEVLGRFGGVPRDNTSDEILETVKEVEALALGTSKIYLQGIAPSARLLDKWRRHLGLPYFYGCALPSRYYLEKNEADFLPEIDFLPDAGPLRAAVHETAIELLPETPSRSISTEA